MRWSLPKAVCFIRRLYSSPSFNRQPPAKGVYNVLEAGVYRGLARYAWLRMVRNQVRNYVKSPIRGFLRNNYQTQPESLQSEEGRWAVWRFFRWRFRRRFWRFGCFGWLRW